MTDYNPKDDEPMFAMSMYANKETLLEAKALYYMGKCEYLEARLALADPEGNTEHLVKAKDYA